MVLGGVHGDPIQPGVELAVAAEIADRAVGTDERLLGDVLAFGVVVHEAADDGADPVLVLEYQQIESGLVTTLYTFDQFQVEFVLTHPGRCSMRPVGPPH